MQMFSLNFSMYTVGGVWRPIEWSSNIAKLLYNVFTFIVVGLLYFLMITQFLDIILVVDNIDDFATNTLMFLTIVAVTCKATIVVVRRNAIITLVQVLLTPPCKPQNEDEMAIQKKFDKFIKSCSIKYSLLATCSVSGVTVRSVLNAMQGYLPYRVWLPYDFNTSPMFWITSIQQIVTVVFVTIINVGTETLVFGLFLQTCAQFEIFENRLRKLVIDKTSKIMTNKVECLKHSSLSSNKKKAIISKYVHHHLEIYKYAKTVNVIFNQVLFVQFFGSILVLCTSVYYLSAHSSLSETATLIIYTICMFVQIYVYCWSGNEVILKSTKVGDSVYHMNWPLLSVNDRRELLMIMLRSSLPLKFTSSFLITLSLQSYSNILKISYSAFNVLNK
ncbi:odorant receptor Or2 [Solenopsis invicta]|uniref:odorant receptor Or2 n=1 Tax=Solenopsis invicta TaxID=13686 RepID=UPI00193CDE73|nr:odorant receptor Or2 [Solenopsis invicta]